LLYISVKDDCDNFTTETVFADQISKFNESLTNAAILKDADHFFNRREKDLMDVIASWILETYNLQGELKNLKTVVV